MRTVYNNGINDMPRGWASENEWNKRVYRTWKDMLMRCYSEKCHERQPTYKGCIVCNDWLYLSNFVRDFKLIDGYNEEKFLKGELCLDKDIKSNGQNKEYSLEECVLVSIEDNTKQAMKTRDNSYLQTKAVIQYDKDMNIIRIWDYAKQASKELGIANSNICACCHGERKSAGGYIFKYVEEE